MAGRDRRHGLDRHQRRAAFAELPEVEGLELVRVEGEAEVLLSHAKRLGDVDSWAVWGAGERREMRAIRQHFAALGLDKQDIAIAGYWRGTLADYDDLAVEV